MSKDEYPTLPKDKDHDIIRPVRKVRLIGGSRIKMRDDSTDRPLSPDDPGVTVGDTLSTISAEDAYFQQLGGESDLVTRLQGGLSEIDLAVLAQTASGLSLREIADLEGVTHTAVRKRLERARRHAKALLSQDETSEWTDAIRRGEADASLDRIFDALRNGLEAA